jgi:hypothetical protein
LLFNLLASAIPGPSDSPHSVAGGVRLIAHDDPEFEAHVSGNYPRIANSELYPKAKKFMAVLRHDGTVTAKAYCVLWTIQQSPNRQRTMRAMYIHKHSMPKAGERKIEPGTARLISPFFNHSAADFKAHPESAELRIPGHFPFLDAEVLSISIDAVIYGSDPANATIAGPDAYDLRSQYLATRYAEHDEAVSVRRNLYRLSQTDDPLQAAALPAQIDEVLKKHIEIGAPRQGLKLEDRYIRARAQEAAILRGALSAWGLDALKKEAHRRSLFPCDQVQPVV